MFCPACGKTLEEGVVFCPNCRAKVSSSQKSTSSIEASSAKKPMTLMYITFYSAFSGVITLAMTGTALFAAGITSGLGGYVNAGQGFLLTFLILLGVSYIVVVYGLWNLIAWSRNLTMAVYAISIPLNIMGLVGKDVSAGMVVIYLFSIAICVGVIYYLTRPEVKRLFT